MPVCINGAGATIQVVAFSVRFVTQHKMTFAVLSLYCFITEITLPWLKKARVPQQHKGTRDLQKDFIPVCLVRTTLQPRKRLRIHWSWTVWVINRQFPKQERIEIFLLPPSRQSMHFNAPWILPTRCFSGLTRGCLNRLGKALGRLGLYQIKESTQTQVEAPILHLDYSEDCNELVYHRRLYT